MICNDGSLRTQMLQTELPHAPEWERKIDYASLDHCQQVGERDEKETKSSLAICAQLHKVAHILMHKGNLPPIEELRKTKTEEKTL
jgi:hypothetical protein